MKTKEAIKWVFDIWHEWENVYGVDTEEVLREGKKMDEVITLLKRGKAFEDMWNEVEESSYSYDDWENLDLEEIKQRYFPQDKVVKQ